MDQDIVQARFRVAMDLHETGVKIMRQNLRRRFPDASDSEIEDLLGRWLSERRGAEDGDSVGRLRT
jgi:hypothetical protein